MTCPVVCEYSLLPPPPFPPRPQVPTTQADTVRLTVNGVPAVCNDYARCRFSQQDSATPVVDYVSPGNLVFSGASSLAVTIVGRNFPPAAASNRVGARGLFPYEWRCSSGFSKGVPRDSDSIVSGEQGCRKSRIFSCCSLTDCCGCKRASVCSKVYGEYSRGHKARARFVRPDEAGRAVPERP